LASGEGKHTGREALSNVSGSKLVVGGLFWSKELIPDDKGKTHIEKRGYQ